MTTKPDLHLYPAEAHGLPSLAATFDLFRKLTGREPTDQERADTEARYAELTKS